MNNGNNNSPRKRRRIDPQDRITFRIFRPARLCIRIRRFYRPAFLEIWKKTRETHPKMLQYYSKLADLLIWVYSVQTLAIVTCSNHKPLSHQQFCNRDDDSVSQKRVYSGWSTFYFTATSDHRVATVQI